MAQFLKLPSYAGLGRSYRVTLSAPNEYTRISIGSKGGSMVKVGRSFSQPFIPQNVAIRNSGDGGASFAIDGPAIRESAASMPFVPLGGTTSSAFDVAALLAAVGGEQIQYIEFNSVHRELETRQRWPLLRLVSELLDQPERPADVVKPGVLHKDGAVI